MKKGFLLAAMATVFSLTVNAQQKPKDRLANLNLTEQQKASVDSVRKIYDGQRADVKKDATVSEEARKEKMKEIRKHQNAAINSILTSEQKKQLKAEAKEKEEKEG